MGNEMVQDEKNPKVLVLLSAYNGETFIGSQLDSLLCQTQENVDIVVRDDGSADGTRTILASYQEKHDNITVISGENVGVAHSFWYLLQYAVQQRDYAYFALCDQDDYWEREKIAVAVDWLEKSDGTMPCMYCSNLKITDAELNVIGLMRDDIPEAHNKAKSLVESFATGCTMVFNRQLLELATAKPVKKLVLHDLWLFQSCMFLGRIYYDPHAHILYRQHQKNEIGAKFTRMQRLRSKMKSIRLFFDEQQRFREIEAINLLDAYQDSLSETDRQLIDIVASYRHRLHYRLGWAFGLLPASRNIRMTKLVDNFFLKIRILLGKV